MVAAEAAAARILALGGVSEAPTPKPTPSGTVPAASTVASPIVPPSSTVVPSPEPVESGSPVTSNAPAASSATSAPVQTSEPSVPQPSAPAASPAPSNPGSSTAKAYERCGGIGHEGPTQCEAGWTCKAQNDWYSQCLQASRARSENSTPVQKRNSRSIRREIQSPSKITRASYLDAYSL